MKTSDRGIIALISHEGIVPGPYHDSVGVLTYGIGHTKAAGYPDPATLVPGMPDNLDAELLRVFQVFKNDLAKYEAEVSRAITIPVEQHEFDAAVSFHYNTGAIGRASWVKSLNAGNKKDAAAKILNWRKPPEIIPRRKGEQELFAGGVYPDIPLTVWNVSKDRRVIWTTAKRLTTNEALGLLRGGVSPDAPSGPGTGGKPHQTGKQVGIAAVVMGAIAAMGAFACKIPFLNTLISNCGG